MSREMSRGAICLIACESGRAFMERVRDNLQRRMEAEGDRPDEFPRIVDCDTTVFDNGEIKTMIRDVIRGSDLYAFQLFEDPLPGTRGINDNIMELMTLLDAAFYSDPETVTVVAPQFPYSRQERRTGREPITAKMIAEMFEIARANRVITLDIHAEAIAGFFRRTRFENILLHNEMAQYFRDNFPTDNLMVVAPDVGSAQRGRTYAALHGTDMAIIDKHRDHTKKHTISELKLVGNVEGRNIFMGDDIIGTGGTIISACRLLKEKGAGDIFLACTFPYFNGKAVERMQAAWEEGLFKHCIGTDAVWHGQEFVDTHEWYVEVSVSRLIADIIYNINRRRSISRLIDSSPGRPE